MSKYCLNIVSDVRTNDALNKPKNDINLILEKKGFEILNIVLLKNKKEKFFYTLNRLHKIVHGLKKNDVLVVNYPTSMGHIFDQLLKKVLVKKRVKTIAIIHDVDSLRFNVKEKRNINYEIKLLNGFDCVISPNHFMSEKLKEKGLSVHVIDLKIFDYLTRNTYLKDRRILYSKNVFYAGNLNKSKFIFELKNDDVHYHLYGPIAKDKAPLVSEFYKGSVNSNKLLDIMNNGFGLIWDGNYSDYIDTSKVSTGSYLKYNNPYKLSSYITAGIPVFIWSGAAEAEFVTNEEVGYAISSLSDISSILKKISESDYYKMCRNVSKFQSYLIEGHFTNEAVSKALDYLK